MISIQKVDGPQPFAEWFALSQTSLIVMLLVSEEILKELVIGAR